MSECYLYKFVHPKKGIIYIGQAKDKAHLDKRIYSHLNNNNDNIDRRYVGDLISSDIYCMALLNFNPAELNIVESILINKYKPICNKADNYKGIHLNIEIEEKWKKFEFDEDKPIKQKRKSVFRSTLSPLQVWGYGWKTKRKCLATYIITVVVDTCKKRRDNIEVNVELSTLCDLVGIEYPFSTDYEVQKLYSLVSNIMDGCVSSNNSSKAFEYYHFLPKDNKLTCKFTDEAYKYIKKENN